MAATTRTFTGIEAASWGLAVRSVPLADLDTAVAELADAIVANSAEAIAAYKDLYAHALDQGIRDGLAYEAATTYAISDTEDRIASFR